MADTTFVDQVTVIVAAWLNDVNDAVYEGVNPSSFPLGPFSFDATKAYVVGQPGAAIQDQVVNVLWFMTEAQRAQVKANGTTLDLTTAINAAKTWGGNRPLYFPAGTYSFTTLSFIGNLGGIIGDGEGVTILKARTSITSLLNFVETADVNPTPFILRDFTLDGDSATTIGVNVRYRHQYLMQSVHVKGCVTGVKELDTYLARHINCHVSGCTTGWWAVGSNHSSQWVGCTFDQNSTVQLLVQTNGTPADGNEALLFAGCDFEFGTTSAVGVDITCSNATFQTCYTGENMPGAALINRGGLVTINGGTLYYGYAAASYGVSPIAGRTVVRGTTINGQNFPSIDVLVGGTVAGVVSFHDCIYNGLVSGSPAMAGDPIDYGPQGTVFAPRLGKNWTGEGNNITFTTTLVGNANLFTCTVAPGPSPLLGAKATLVAPTTWLDGSPWYVILVYESSKALNLTLSGSAFGGAPLKTIQASIPATSGTKKTAICFQTNADAAAYVLVEIIQASTIVGDTLKIYECIFADARMLDKLTGQFGNLYKC